MIKPTASPPCSIPVDVAKPSQIGEDRMAELKKTLLRALSLSVFTVAIAGCSGGGSSTSTPPPTGGGGGSGGGGSGGGSGGGDGSGGGSDGGTGQSDIETFAGVTVFESGHVRPLALSADGNSLYAVNTPDNMLEIFDLASGSPVHSLSIPVGMEPVAVSVAANGDAWVVNHLSDSISIVDMTAENPVVSRTLHVGDEPRDIVFGGPGSNKAFITTAHRGQNAPFNPQLTEAGIGRADVWVFDINNLGEARGGTPVTITNLFSDTPRALAVSPDGNTVYAAAFHSGNQTTTLFADRNSGGLDKAPPLENIEGIAAPQTGLIVRYNGTDWMDNGDPVSGTAPKVWTDRIRFSLPDYDVFELDAAASVPGVTARHSAVGTTLFNMVTNPATGALYVSNTDARNDVRFEGHSNVSTSVRGNMVRTRISVLENGAATHRNLNKHINSYSEDLGTATENALSTSQVLQMAVTANGEDIYGAAFGNGKLFRYKTSDLENNSFTPAAGSQVKLSGGGPTGLVLDETRGQAYVLTRFDNGISTVSLDDLSESAHITMFHMEPSHVVEGRPFLYDAELSSSRGDHSCASCHTFGDADQLAWDLGEPDGTVKDNPRRYAVNPGNAIQEFHPMKGPMTTQSLRGLAGNGPMHWRGDRTGVSADAGETLEEQAFEDFNPAFQGLLGKADQLSDSQMDLFAKFALEITYPPNPIRNLDNSLTAEQEDGRDTYLNVGSTGGGLLRCNQCHELDEVNNKFGTNGLMSVEGNQIAEDFKIPHLRNTYTKVGRFGSTNRASDGAPHMGPQIRGYGFLHDGAIDTLDTFFGESTGGASTGGAGFVFNSPQAKANVIDFVFAMDSELAPIVGQQVTLSATNADDEDSLARLDLLVERAGITTPRSECDLVARGVIAGEQRGAVMNSDGSFDTDKLEEAGVSLDQLKSLAGGAGNSLTFMCAPPREGRRIAIDRDADEYLNADEIAAGSDASDPNSIPE